ncbi:class I SAM-dependent methyltransferase [Mycobacterium sp. OAE908]|uniref:class I SAM-dependent methyltransferase n=1 Tax=Mycobacterium sp. OAE908 TaxID=2817899 RepID=UPI001AE114B5
MSLFYSVAYAVGFTPWEAAGEADRATLKRLFAREEAERAAPGKALDLGCGTGMHTLELAARGWTVTGVDSNARAVTRAKRRLAEQRLPASAMQADVTDLGADDVGAGYDFFLDIGCYHGLSPHQRTAMGRSVTALAAPGATLLLLAFQPDRLPRPLPRGANRSTIEKSFPGWDVTETDVASTEGMPRPLRKAAPTWYRLRYKGAA